MKVTSKIYSQIKKSRDQKLGVDDINQSKRRSNLRKTEERKEGDRFALSTEHDHRIFN